MFVLFVIAYVTISVNGQMIPQCLCKDVNACYAKAPDTVMKCSDRCQSHFSSLGASYPEARACIVSHLGQINGALSCTRSALGNVCAAHHGEKVPRRYTETIQLATFREINGMLQRSGIASQATALLQVARRALGCIVKCMQSQQCGGKGCGLALPPDNEVVSTFKECAMRSGFLTTKGFREMCSCLSASGLKQLTPLCKKIVIT